MSRKDMQLVLECAGALQYGLAHFAGLCSRPNEKWCARDEEEGKVVLSYFNALVLPPPIHTDLCTGVA